MTQKIINIGAQGDDGTGDTIRSAFDKVNTNFTDVYNSANQTLISNSLTNLINSKASITYVNTVVTNSTSSLATRINELQTSFNTLTTGTGATVSYVDTAISNSTASFASALQTLQTNLTNLTTKTDGSFTNLVTIISNSTGTITSRVDQLSADFKTLSTGTGATIAYVDTAVANSTSSLASSYNTLSSTLNGLSTTVTQHTSSINGIQAKYSVTLNANGAVSGFALISGASGSVFKVNTDTFQLAGSGLNSTIIPFVVDTVNQKIIMTANVTINGNLNGVGGTFAGALSAATGSFSGSLNAAGGTFAGALSAATGTFSGLLSAAGGTFNGALSAATGTFSGNLSAAGGTFAGNLSAAGGSFKGDITAATGSFSGSLNAAGGTFAGALSAATGSFRGSLSAATGSFAGDISAATGTFSGAVRGGAFTTYNWPPAGQTGFYLSYQGLLIGNANDGRYIQIDSNGNISAPGFSITNGVMNIGQVNVINTANVVNNAITEADSYPNGFTGSVSFYVPVPSSIIIGAVASISANNQANGYEAVLTIPGIATWSLGSINNISSTKVLLLAAGSYTLTNSSANGSQPGNAFILKVKR
jgi:hypothetical protein